MKETTKAAAAIAAAAIITASWATATATANVSIRQEAKAARTAETQASAERCETVNGYWYRAANGAPRCETASTSRTMTESPERCQETGGRSRKDSGVALCDHDK